MAYQNVGRPRFYLNVLEWLAFNGVGGLANIYRTLPVGPMAEYQGENYGFYNTYGTLTDKSFIALLGHTTANNSYEYATNPTSMQSSVVNSQGGTSTPAPPENVDPR